jgi:cell wall assembly regulator SMI1
MPDRPAMLTPNLLDELEQRWRDQEAFIATALRPGLSDEQMDELTAPLEITLPAEARLWWRWHDGANASTVDGVAGQFGPGDFVFLPLARAVQQCEEIRGVLSSRWTDGFGPEWQHGWLPITYHSNPRVIDCGGNFEDPVPARWFSFEEQGFGDHQGVASMGELVQLWIRTIDSGGWSYNKDERVWERDRAKLDPEGLRLHLA